MGICYWVEWSQQEIIRLWVILEIKNVSSRISWAAVVQQSQSDVNCLGGELEQKTLKGFWRRSFLGELEGLWILRYYFIFFKNLSLKNFLKTICSSLVKEDSRKKYFLQCSILQIWNSIDWTWSWNAISSFQDNICSWFRVMFLALLQGN